MKGRIGLPLTCPTCLPVPFKSGHNEDGEFIEWHEGEESKERDREGEGKRVKRQREGKEKGREAEREEGSG